jgi:cytochrome c-type biogenesis protein CcmH
VLLWISIAILTAAAIMAVLLPLGRPARESDPDEQARRVYRDQLKELERDKAEGRISADEAEAARTEIARRLLAVGEATSEAGPPVGGSLTARRAAALVGLIGIPAVSLGLYLSLGAPALPGQPLAARLAEPAAVGDVEALIARVEDHLAREPEDGRGWDVVAPVYLQLGRADDAAQAYRNAIRLLGSTAERQTGLGEAILAAEGGVVTADAREAFEAANALDPDAPAPRFYLALAAEQEGDLEGAAEWLRALLADAPADASWRPAVEESLARVESPNGPTAEQMAAAEEMSPEEQTAMIEGMVDGLAARLREEPNDAEGWLRLIRSYVVLGRTSEAAEAGRDALAGIQAQEDRARVEALLAELAVTPAGASTQ